MMSAEVSGVPAVLVIRAARCDNANAGPYVLLLFLSFFFYSAPDLRGLSADRRETLPHDRKWVQF